MGTTEKPGKKPVAKKSNKQKYVVKFDSSGFWLAFGLGIVIAAIGVLIVWATKTAPEVGTSSTAINTSQRIARMMPESVKEWLAIILGGLFVVFGVIMVLMSFKLVIKYFIDKARE